MQTLEETKTEPAAPVEPSTITAADDTLELLEAVKGDLLPDAPRNESGESGEEATSSTGEQTEQEQPETDDVSRKPLPREVQQSIDKRIGKEVSKRKELELELENERASGRELEERLKEAQAAKSEPSVVIRSDDPYLGLTEEELDKKEKDLIEFKGWALRNLDGYTGSGEENDPDWQAEEIRERYAQVEVELASKIPEARNRLTQRRAIEARAVEQFPFLADKDKPGFEEAARLYNTQPFQELLKVDPSALVLLGHAARDIYNSKNNPEEGSPAPAAPPVIPTEARPAGGPGPAAPTGKKNPGLTAERMEAAREGRLEDVVGEMLGL